MSIQQWHQFLQHSAIQYPLSEINPSLTEKTVICDLSHLGLLQIQGSDASTFLQGQLTNDIKQLHGSNAHYTAYCNAKGRMLAIFLAFAQDSQFFMQLPKALVEPITKRLRMFILRSKVEIHDASASMIKIGLNGPHAPSLLSTLFSEIPTQENTFTTHDNITLLRLSGTQPRFEILTDIEHASEIWQILSAQATPVTADVWEWLDIHSGIPDIKTSTQEAFVPQMLNLDLLDGINFKKGCYTGQEIVARTHYLGKVKRRMHLAHLDTSAVPQPGEIITDSTHEPAGKIARCAPAPGGGYDILAELRLDSLENSPLLVNAVQLEIKTLPYALTSA
ncbi:MAG: folate-binding protein [Betaproteobacteria bacterium HGW-Betaproteobacteria-22]|nr:MAG: folate-binding protein [Betaproteobacteria bacterium HGW-Betaproteobacteria-22]